MGKYNFSLASINDISEIFDIYRNLVGTPGCTWNSEYPNEEIVESDIHNKSLYILKDNNRIVAVAAAGSFNELDHLQWGLENPCELARVGVISTMQNQGLGTTILQNVIEAVKERGFDGIRMVVSKINLAALALYDKNGFEKCGEAFMYGIDFNCYQMKFSPAL